MHNGPRSLPIILCLVVWACSVAQSTKATDSKRTLPKPQVFSKPHKWAVVIGVGDFQNSEWNLKYARKDAVDFRNYLVDEAGFAPDHVKLLLDKTATKENITQALDWLGKVAAYHDLAMIYIRTRGALADRSEKTREFLAINDKAPEWASAFIWGPSHGCIISSTMLKGRDYLVVHDTTPETLDASAIDMTTFVRDVVLNRIHAGATVIVADADFSGTIWRGEAPGTELMDGLPNGHSFLLVCSSDDNEISWESDAQKNSVFTHALIQALGKQATAPFLDTAFSTRGQVQNDVRALKADRTQVVMTMGIYSGRSGADVVIGTHLTDQEKHVSQNNSNNNVKSSLLNTSSENFDQGDRDRMSELWKAAIENCPRLRSAIAILSSAGWEPERISQSLDDSLQNAIDKRQMQPYSGILSLTEPLLEPTYPVVGGQAPAYLLPALAKARTSASTIIGARIGEGVGAAAAAYIEITGANDIAKQLVQLYAEYKNRRQSSIAPIDSLPDPVIHLRDSLTKIVGTQALERLDTELSDGFSTQKAR